MLPQNLLLIMKKVIVSKSIFINLFIIFWMVHVDYHDTNISFKVVMIYMILIDKRE